MSLLQNIKSPADFRQFSTPELEVLAEEVRERILSVVSETGGHLASSLGTVELTIALHYAFNTPVDKIVWDVGHQCYAHKILTGRNDQFHSIRQYKGLSGFPRPAESEYDVFDVGHASTSISSALGLVEANAILGKSDRVVAVIGDGSMTGGLAFEGLNNAGASKKDFIVILNDNKMSISPNVGAMSSYLTKVISDPRYNKLKKDLWELTGKMKNVGQGIRTVASRLEEGIKGALLPGRVFEDLGFRYFGPIDGHDINELVSLFKNIQLNVKGPVLIHLVTKKGKGYAHAEKDAPKFHGVGGFEKETGQCLAKHDTVSWSYVFGQTITKISETHKDIVAVTAAMPTGTGLDNFAAKFPERYFDVGIAEGHAITFASGLAKAGLLPVVALYSTFLQRAYDNVIHDIALQNLKIIIGIDRGGLTPDDGPTHHGLFDLAFLRCVPNLTLLAPKDGEELQDMIYTAVKEIKGPVCIRYPRGNVPCGVVKTDYSVIPIKPEMVIDGEKILFVAYGEMVETAIKSAQILSKSGINASVLNLRVLKPLDTNLISEILKKYEFVFTLEMGVVSGGVGSAITELVRDCGITLKKVHSFGFPDNFVPHGDKESLLKECGLTPPAISETILQKLN